MRAFPVMLLAAIAAGGTARADGVYFTQMIGIGSADTPLIGRTLQTRAGIGARVRNVAIESWVASDSAPARDGATFGVIGGEPRTGTDLASYGVATRWIVPIRRTRTSLFEGYARLGAGIVEASGRLDGWGGHTMIAGGGFSIRGRVRALGFLWGPLFFVNRGPRVTAALFADYGYERLELTAADRVLRTGMSHSVLGFAIGSSF